VAGADPGQRLVRRAGLPIFAVTRFGAVGDAATKSTAAWFRALTLNQVQLKVNRMNTVINAKELRASLPAVVEKVRRGARFTVLYRSRPAFQVIPVDVATHPKDDLEDDPLYRAKALGRSTDGRSAADHDTSLYRT
jgi:antitoxin (DNA-binding transcriptional repressor) of toxin-antitoxin stability system